MRGCEKHSQSWRAHLRLPLRLNQVVNSLKLLPTLPTWPTWPTLPTDRLFCHESQTADLHQCMAHLAPGGSGEGGGRDWSRDEGGIEATGGLDAKDGRLVLTNHVIKRATKLEQLTFSSKKKIVILLRINITNLDLLFDFNRQCYINNQKMIQFSRKILSNSMPRDGNDNFEHSKIKTDKMLQY